MNCIIDTTQWYQQGMLLGRRVILQSWERKEVVDKYRTKKLELELSALILSDLPKLHLVTEQGEAQPGTTDFRLKFQSPVQGVSLLLSLCGRRKFGIICRDRYFLIAKI